MVKVTDCCLACHELEPSAAEDPSLAEEPSRDKSVGAQMPSLWQFKPVAQSMILPHIPVLRSLRCCTLRPSTDAIPQNLPFIDEFLAVSVTIHTFAKPYQGGCLLPIRLYDQLTSSLPNG
ncbi:hypothetical protein TNCV_57021 [Trichonephila clavipes]|nr:hypothetical protein TNCV_57021 [Trichonephila clavipes]